MKHQLGHGGYPAQIVLVIALQIDQLFGQQHDKKQLDHFGRGDVEGQPGELQPVPVALVVCAERDQQQDKQGAEDKDQLPFFHQDLQVDIIADDEHGNAQHHGDGLLAGQGVISGVEARGGVDQDQTIDICDDAQHQQNDVRPLEEVFDPSDHGTRFHLQGGKQGKTWMRQGDYSIIL